MPQGDVLTYFREKDPRFRDVSDADLTAYIKDKYPDFGAELGGQNPSFTKKKGEGLTPQERELRRRYANTLTEGAAAREKQEIKNAWGNFAGEVAAAVPAAIAAPMTGGGSLAAMGIMGGAGLAGGLLREGTKAAIGSSDMPQDAGQLAKSLTLDALLGAGGEGGARAVGAVGLNLAPKVIQRAAATTEKGSKLLKDLFTDTSAKLYQRIQSKAVPLIDVEPELRAAVGTIRSLPKAVGQTGQRFGATTSAANDILKRFEDDLAIGGGGVATKQPLDGLIRAHRSLQEAAYHEAGLATEEATHLQRVSDKIGTKIRQALGRDPAALKLYEDSQRIYKTQRENTVATTLAETFLKKQTQHMTAFGVTANAAAQMVGKSSAWVLEKVLSNPRAAPTLRRAIEFGLQGDKGKASELATRAFVIAGAREQVKSWMKEAEGMQPDLSELVPPAAAADRGPAK